MRRFYLVHDDHMPTAEDSHLLGTWHAVHLGSHGDAGKSWNVVGLVDEHIQPPTTWKAAPKLVDGRSPIRSHVDHRLLADLGLTGAETMVEVMQRLGEIHPLMSH